MLKAFHQHDTTTPEGRETSAFSASHWIQANTLDTAECEDLSITGQRQKRSPASKQNAVYNRIRPFGATSPAEAQLLSQLPQLEAATLLLDNYFDRIHWFMLVFHQSDFKERFRQLYEGIRRPLPELRAPLGFLGVFAAVCVISLSYTNAQQKAKLSSCGIQPAVLRQQLLTTLRLRLLDVVSQGSIEAVQACVLLGSFYLYHGEPELAWPICGCGLRIAQALNLHRRIPSQVFGPPDLDNPTQRAEETRKRCWWAVYEIETFCSMLYGFPLSINDDDCDVDLLDPYPLRSGDSSWHAVSWKEKGQATLLSYKHSMVQLSIIVKSALVDLYGLRRSSPEKRTPRVSGQHRLHSLIATVANLEQRLQLWYTNLPKQLLIDSITVSGVGLRKAALNETSANTYFHHLFPLQALSLKLGFENARILIHRPLLSYKMVTSARTTNMQGHPHTTNAPDPCRSSIQTCRDAALQISTISSLPIVRDAADTYAASFVSLHLLTAAVALCILTSLNPLSQESYDCKMGIRRLMEMQSRLRARSIVAEQGLGVSKKLLSLVLTKEMEKMLEMPHQTEETGNEVEAAQNAQGTCSTSGKRQTQTENKLGESDSSNGHAVDRPSIEVASVSTSATNTAANLTLDFYEDPMIAQALQEFEQGNLLPSHIRTPPKQTCRLIDSQLSIACLMNQLEMDLYPFQAESKGLGVVSTARTTVGSGVRTILYDMCLLEIRYGICFALCAQY